MTHYADISVLDSSPILGIARDKSRGFKGSQAILGGKSRNDCSNSHKAYSSHYAFGMRFKGSFTKGLLVALIFTLVPIAAFSAQKITPGSTCKVLNQKVVYQNKTYTCIKSGKKLIWNKGVAVKKPTPIPTPSPSPVKTPTIDNSFAPWSTEFAIENVSERAFKSFLDWSKEQASSPRKHQVIVQDTLKDFKIGEDLRKIDEFTSGLFSQYFKTQSVTVLGSDEQWVISQIFASGGNLRNSQGRCNERYDIFSLCMNRDSHIGMVVLDDCLLSKFPSCGISHLPHEYFHLVQLNLADNVEGQHWNYGFEKAKNSFPHWLVEGSANFIASAIASIYLDGKYSDFREQSLFNRPTGPHMANALVDYEIRTPNQGWNDGLYSYNIGHIATEYIVASIGFQKFLEIWKDYAVTKNFYLSFERVTGISTTTFYSKFESARQSLRIPPVTWKRDENLQNKKINP